MRCPFCNIQDESCEHLLLTVDTTFREAQNGALYEWFSDAWDAVWEREGDDFDEYIEFEELLDVVDFYADADADADAEAEAEGEFEGGPGQSSGLRSFYCKEKSRVDEAVKKLRSNLNESISNQLQAEDAIEHTMRWVSDQKGKCSLDDVVHQLLQQPGAVKVIDERPLVTIVSFADGSGVGANQNGLDLLESTQNGA